MTIIQCIKLMKFKSWLVEEENKGMTWVLI